MKHALLCLYMYVCMVSVNLYDSALHATQSNQSLFLLNKMKCLEGSSDVQGVPYLTLEIRALRAQLQENQSKLCETSHNVFMTTMRNEM